MRESLGYIFGKILGPVGWVFGGFCLWGGSGSRGCFHDDLLQPKSLIISIDEMVNWQKKSMEISLLLNASTRPCRFLRDWRVPSTGVSTYQIVDLFDDVRFTSLPNNSCLVVHTSIFLLETRRSH